MNKRTRTNLLLALALPALALPSAGALAAPAIADIVAAPSPARAGQPVKVTVGAGNADNAICGLTVHWDDGQSERPQKVGDKWGGFPRTFEHTYAKPGTYKIKAEGQRAGTFLACGGEATTTLVVEAAAKAAAPGATKTPCPDGWGMKGKAAKDGSFTCTPKKKGAAKPEKALDCPAGTSYFMGNKALGCEKTQ